MQTLELLEKYQPDIDELATELSWPKQMTGQQVRELLARARA